MVDPHPYRAAPLPSGRFFFTEDGETFVDLKRVEVAFARRGADQDLAEDVENDDVDEETFSVEIWTRGNSTDDGFRLWHDDARSFMQALAAYRGRA